MKLIRYTLLLSIVFLTFCTNNQNRSSLSDATPSINLEGEKVFKNQFGISSIQVADSIILITSKKNEFFHIYDKKENKIADFGKEGRGPGEFLRPPFIKQISSRNGDISTTIYDDMQKKAVIVNLEKSINQSNLVVQHEFSLPKKIKNSFIQSLYVTNKGKYVSWFDQRLVSDEAQTSKSFIFDPREDSLQTFSLKNLEIEPYEGMAELNLNMKKSVIAPEKGKIVFAMMHSPILEILDFETKNINEYKLTGKDLKQSFSLEKFKKREIPIYTLNISATDKHIYVLTPIKEFDQCKKCQKIRVLDWKGNILRHYLLSNEYNLDWITLNEESKILYGLSWENDTIYRFNLDKSSI